MPLCAAWDLNGKSFVRSGKPETLWQYMGKEAALSSRRPPRAVVLREV